MTKQSPPGWNKTLAQLMDEVTHGIRPGISGDEAGWAIDYERSQLPPGTIFPLAGEVWTAVVECQVQVHYVFAAPVSNSGTGMLAAGEKVRVMGGVEPRPIVVSFLPLRYDALHTSLVPEDVLCEPRYTNYALSLDTAVFNEYFRRCVA